MIPYSDFFLALMVDFNCRGDIICHFELEIDWHLCTEEMPLDGGTETPKKKKKNQTFYFFDIEM